MTCLKMFIFSGNFYLSYVDPVIIGRGVFNVTNNSICGVVGYIQGTLCVLLDAILDILQGMSTLLLHNIIFYKYYFISLLILIKSKCP